MTPVEAQQIAATSLWVDYGAELTAIIAALLAVGSLVGGLSWRLSRLMGRVYGEVGEVRRDMATMRGEMREGNAVLGGRIDSLTVEVRATNGRMERAEGDIDAMRLQFQNALEIHREVMKGLVEELRHARSQA